MNEFEELLIEKIDEQNKKFDVIIALLSAGVGLSKEDIGFLLNVSEKTIQRMIPFGKIKNNLKEKKNEETKQ